MKPIENKLATTRMQICLSLLRRSAGNPRELRNPFPLIFPFPGRTGGEKGTDLSPGCTGPLCALGHLPFADARRGWRDPGEAAPTPSARGWGARGGRGFPPRQPTPALRLRCCLASPEPTPARGLGRPRAGPRPWLWPQPSLSLFQRGSSPGPVAQVLRSLWELTQQVSGVTGRGLKTHF